MARISGTDTVMKQETPKTMSPLEGHFGCETVSLSELTFLGKIILRGNASDKAFMAAAKKCLGKVLPIKPLTSAEVGNIRIFWKAFDEWLIWTEAGEEKALINKLRVAFSEKIHGAVVDVSDYYTVIRLEGTYARDTLEKGCVLDLHPNHFPIGHATGSNYHQAGIFITRIADEGWDVMIRWSHASYLWSYFCDSAREWS